MARRHRHLRHPPTGVPRYSLGFVAICMCGFVSFIGILVILAKVNGPMTTTATTRLYSDPNKIPSQILKKLDAVLVLGGGVPESVDHPPLYVERRADDAAAVVQRYGPYWKGTRRTRAQTRKRRQTQQQQVEEQKSTRSLGSKNDVIGASSSLLPILCLSAGTAHMPQLLSSGDGLPIWESTACAAYLERQHGLTDNVFVETTSYDTIGNAYATRTFHTDVNGWRNLLVITSEFHMDRTRAIFDWIFLKCDKDKKRPYQVHYLQSPNVGLAQAALDARREREVLSAKNVREVLAPQNPRLKDVWHFLTHDHSLYTASKLVDRGRGDGDAKASGMVQQSYGGDKH